MRVSPDGLKVDEAALAFVLALKEVEAKYERKPVEREPRSTELADPERREAK